MSQIREVIRAVPAEVVRDYDAMFGADHPSVLKEAASQRAFTIVTAERHFYLVAESRAEWEQWVQRVPLVLGNSMVLLKSLSQASLQPSKDSHCVCM